MNRNFGFVHEVVLDLVDEAGTGANLDPENDVFIQEVFTRPCGWTRVIAYTTAATSGPLVVAVLAESGCGCEGTGHDHPARPHRSYYRIG